jgi:gliding motility-associated-like protein
VIVYNNPVADFSKSLVCAGDNISFTNLSSSSDGTIISNAWDFNGDNVVDLDAQVPKYTYPSTGFFQVTLEVKTQNGCKSSKTIPVYSNAKAVPTFTSNAKDGCPELCVNFKNLSTISSGTFTSKWDFGDATSTSSAYNPSHCFREGTFNVTLELRSDSGCKSTLNANDYIRVFPNPVAAFRVEPEFIDEDEPTITVQSMASSDATVQKYYISDGASYGVPNFTHYIKNLEKRMRPMIVQVVKNRFGCVDTLYKILDVKPAFAIYVPNVFTPNSDNRNDGFQAKGVGIAKFAMQIYDRWGHLVWSTNEITDSWDGTVKGDYDSIKEDVYTWKAQVIDILNNSHALVGHVTLLR